MTITKINNQEFNFIDEVNKTVTQSLVTTFGLDFLLFEDKKGGNVATIHNVRQHQKGNTDIYISDSVRHDYDNKGDYKPARLDGSGKVVTNKRGKVVKDDFYHSHPSYKAKGKSDKIQHKNGQLIDEYRGQVMSGNEKRQLDHVISSHEVHNDAGRVLAGLSGVDLANRNSNFQSTHYYINNLKSNHSMDDFLATVVPQTIVNKQKSIEKNINIINSMPTGTKEQRHERRQLESKIAKEKEKLEVLKGVDEGKMREADKMARREYNQEIGFTYYTSSDFLKSTAIDSGKAGLKMGVRQSLGLILAEVWFELKEAIPKEFKKIRGDFTLEKFFGKLKNIANDVWDRVRKRFKDILSEFKSGVLAGALSSLSSTIMNIFFTTQKLIGKLLREMWLSLVSAAKVLFFNPKKLGAGDLTREVLRILSTGVAVAMGVILNQQLMSLMTFPMGIELASFVSAVATGLMTIGISYFFDHSRLMQKVWSYLNRLKSEARRTLEYFQKVNVALDCYLIELSKIEFNLSPTELKRLLDGLESSNCEVERSIILSKEITRRGIDLPFESNNLDSTRNWLMSL